MTSRNGPQRTLITFVGTGDYSETVYQWQGVGEHRTAHIAAALGALWKATGIVALATQPAEDKNGDPMRGSLAAAGLPEPLFKRLPDGRNEGELWMQFQVMREAIEVAAGGDALIDITHGFRAQPFFAGAVLSVLRAARIEADNLALVYGEYRKDETTSPIWDLTLFTELMDWAQALGLFLRTGVAAPVVELGRRMQRREAGLALVSASRGFPRFGRLVGAIERFANDLATIRVASIITGYEQDDSKKHNARGSAASLLETIDECRGEVAAKLPPLALILDELAESVRPLSAGQLFGENGQRAQHALARHYLSLARYPEAAAVVREARVNRCTDDERAVEVNSTHFDQQRRFAADRRFSEDPAAREIAQVRNDIEHCGFNEQPLSAAVLQSRIEQLVGRVASVDLSEGQSTHAEALPRQRPRTFFATRHTGAVEWVARQGIAIDRTVQHLDVAEVQPGDLVVGTLPVHLAADVRARGARYLHLVLELPPESRGLELTADDMDRFGARLSEYRVDRIP